MPVWRVRQTPATQGSIFCLAGGTFMSQGDLGCLGADLSQHDSSSASPVIVEVLAEETCERV